MRVGGWKVPLRMHNTHVRTEGGRRNFITPFDRANHETRTTHVDVCARYPFTYIWNTREPWSGERKKPSFTVNALSVRCFPRLPLPPGYVFLRPSITHTSVTHPIALQSLGAVLLLLPKAVGAFRFVKYVWRELLALSVARHGTHGHPSNDTRARARASHTPERPTNNTGEQTALTDTGTTITTTVATTGRRHSDDTAAAAIWDEYGAVVLTPREEPAARWERTRYSYTGGGWVPDDEPS